MKVKHVLMIAAVLLAMIVVPVAADDHSKDTTITATADAEYSITIPEGFNFASTAMGATASGSVDVDVVLIDPNYCVQVIVETANEWKLYHTSGSGDTLSYTMTVDNEEINDGDVVVSTPTDKSTDVVFTLDEDATKSGSYQDRLTFTATMEEIQILVSTVQELQNALDTASKGLNTIKLGADIIGDVIVTQEPDVKITINGAGKKYSGFILVDGKSACYDTAALTIKNVNFEAASISADAFIRLGDGTTATRYTNHVTVMDCTFTNLGNTDIVAVKSYTGGDYNLILDGCTVTEKMHSLAQLDNVEKGLQIIDCTVTSIRGVSLNSCESVYMEGCSFDVQKYAVRLGDNSINNLKDYQIINCNLKSNGLEDDTVIMFRGDGVYSKLVMTDITLEGTTPLISGNTEKTTIIWAVDSADELATAAKNGATEVILADGEYNVYGCSGKTLTISGTRNAVLKIMNEGEDGCDYGFDGSIVTFNGISIDTTANTGNYKGYARLTATFNDCNFFGAYTSHQEQTFNTCTFDFNNGYFWTWGANSVTFDDCTFNGNSKAILAHGGKSTVININNCDFAATEKGYTGSDDNTAAVEIDPTGSNKYAITFTGTNTKTDSYSDWTRVKDDSIGHIIVGV